jgi:hypothetical protein
MVSLRPEPRMPLPQGRIQHYERLPPWGIWRNVSFANGQATGSYIDAEAWIICAVRPLWDEFEEAFPLATPAHYSTQIRFHSDHSDCSSCLDSERALRRVETGVLAPFSASATRPKKRSEAGFPQAASPASTSLVRHAIDRKLIRVGVGNLPARTSRQIVE